MIALEYDQITVIEDGEEHRVSISIEKPKKSTKGDFSCSFKMEGLGQNFSKEVFAVSKPQAMLFAIELANYLILNSKEHEAGNVYCYMSDGSKELLVPELIATSIHDP